MRHMERGEHGLGIGNIKESVLTFSSDSGIVVMFKGESLSFNVCTEIFLNKMI